MKVAVKKIFGNWNDGYALDKHVLSSVYVGDDEYGHPQFDTTRTEAGEAVFQLKYRQDWTQVETLANALAADVCNRFTAIDFVVPMPASKVRVRQPVTEVVVALGKVLGMPVFCNLLLKIPNGAELKNLNTKEEKLEVLKRSFSVEDEIRNSGKWNVLLVDDLIHTGASLEAATSALLTYPKVKSVYVATLTWR